MENNIWTWFNVVFSPLPKRPTPIKESNYRLYHQTRHNKDDLTKNDRSVQAAKFKVYLLCLLGLLLLLFGSLGDAFIGGGINFRSLTLLLLFLLRSFSFWRLNCLFFYLDVSGNRLLLLLFLLLLCNKLRNVYHQ